MSGWTWTFWGLGNSVFVTGGTVTWLFVTCSTFVTTWLTGVTVIILTFWTYTLWRVDSSLFTDITTVSIATSQTFIFTSSTKSFTIIIKSISTWTWRWTQSMTILNASHTIATIITSRTFIVTDITSTIISSNLMSTKFISLSKDGRFVKSTWTSTFWSGSSNTWTD